MQHHHYKTIVGAKKRLIDRPSDKEKLQIVKVLGFYLYFLVWVAPTYSMNLIPHITIDLRGCKAFCGSIMISQAAKGGEGREV